jgi:ABC-2 type transport system permease protein
MGSNFVTPNNIFPWLGAALAFVISYVMSFFMTASLGLLTIWQNQPEGFFILYDISSKWLGGALVPLALMPGWIGDWLQWLPFAYLYSLPVKIFMGMPGEQILQGIAVQLGWLALAVIFFSWFWRKALDRYEVFEGK